jgi:oxygen-independent coproporphyrinogen III oxidase
MSPTLGLYISIPFCRAKCTYCNFASGVFPAAEHERYVEHICAEIRSAHTRAASAAWLLPECIGSIYLGGGTPSTLAPHLLQAIFSAIRDSYLVEHDAETTIECAPGQIAPEFLKAMVEISATRVSLGVQSMIDAEATATGRRHTRAIVQEDVRRLREAGLAVNIDLIAGLPGQTIASWQESLEAVSALNVEHASLYMLEVDEDSRLGRELIGGGRRYGAGLVPTDDAIAAMYEAGCARLEQAGLRQYEISNFARPGCESRHNLRYWRRQPYLGVGLDAHSMLLSQDGAIVRFSNPDDLPAYMTKPPAGASTDTVVIDRAARLEESWFLGLRLNEGLSLAALSQEFGKASIVAFDDVLSELVAEGLLTRASDRVTLTLRGRMLSNEVFSRFLGVTSAEEPELSLLQS